MTIERVDWETFDREIFRWNHDEHVSFVGPTNCGKTTLALSILERRRWVVAFGTKPEDKTLARLVRRPDWERAYSWNDVRKRSWVADAAGEVPPAKIVLWPKFRRVEDQARHPYVFDQALRAMFAQGGWTVFADETRYLTQRLKLQPIMETWWMQGRSIGLSVVGATQRPAWVPLEMWSQCTHLFMWRTNDKRDLIRLREISGTVDNLASLADQIMELDFHAHEVLYLDTRSGKSFITIPPE